MGDETYLGSYGLVDFCIDTNKKALVADIDKLPEVAVDIDIPWEIIDKAIVWREQQRLKELYARPDVAKCNLCGEFIRDADLERHVKAHGHMYNMGFIAGLR